MLFRHTQNRTAHVIAEQSAAQRVRLRILLVLGILVIGITAEPVRTLTSQLLGNDSAQEDSTENANDIAAESPTRAAAEDPAEDAASAPSSASSDAALSAASSSDDLLFSASASASDSSLSSVNERLERMQNRLQRHAASGSGSDQISDDSNASVATEPKSVSGADLSGGTGAILTGSGALSSASASASATVSASAGTGGTLTGSGTDLTGSGTVQSGSGALSTESGTSASSAEASVSISASGAISSASSAIAEDTEPRASFIAESGTGFPSTVAPRFAIPLTPEIAGEAELLQRMIVQVTDAQGNALDVQTTITENRENYVVTLEPPRTLTPGRYRLVVTLDRARGVTRVLQKFYRLTAGADDQEGVMTLLDTTFPWGTVAVNTDQDLYAPGENVALQAAILDESGTRRCLTELRAEFPAGASAIAQNFCTGSGAPLMLPLPRDSAAPVITLALNPPVAGLGRAYQTIAQAAEAPPLIVRRESVTVAAPGQNQTMSIRLEFDGVFKGTIRESVPAGFGVWDTRPPALIREQGDQGTEIVWEGAWSESTTFSYSFRAPEQAPLLGLFGPLDVRGDLQEPEEPEEPEETEETEESEEAEEAGDVSSTLTSSSLSSSLSSSSSPSSSSSSLSSASDSSSSASADSSLPVASSADASANEEGQGGEVSEEGQRGQRGQEGQRGEGGEVSEEGQRGQRGQEGQRGEEGEERNDNKERGESDENAESGGLQGAIRRFFSGIVDPRALIASLTYDRSALTYEEQRRWQVLVAEPGTRSAAEERERTLVFEREAATFQANASPRFTLVETELHEHGILDERGALKREIAYREILHAVISEEDLTHAVTASAVAAEAPAAAQETAAFQRIADDAAVREVAGTIADPATEEQIVNSLARAAADGEEPAVTAEEIDAAVAESVAALPAQAELLDRAVADAAGAEQDGQTGAPDEPSAEATAPIEVLQVSLTGPTGERIDDPSFHFQTGSVVLALDPIPAFRPGLYTVAVTVTDPLTREAQTFSQQFVWGVLALNADRDSYPVGATAEIHMGVLDDQGEIVCDAPLTLTARFSDGSVRTLSTELQGIEVTGTCGLKQAGFIGPDYRALLPLSSEGEVSLTLTAVVNGRERAIESRLIVERDPVITVSRSAATRLWPQAPSPMTVTVRFHAPVRGEVVETLPAGFVVTESQPTGTVSSASGGVFTLRWSGSWAAGEEATFRYSYDAPDVSPYFYLLGPLRVLSSLPFVSP